MADPDHTPLSPQPCWFCNRSPGTEHSVVLPFWSNSSDEVFVLVLPRCEACFLFHRRQMVPSGLIILGCAALGAIPVSLLPWPESLRGAAIMIAMVSGLAVGIYLTANRESKQAEARGTKAIFDYVSHPPYRKYAADTKAWRQQRKNGIGDGSGSTTYRETIAECRNYFLHIAGDTDAMKALERACKEVGLDAYAGSAKSVI